MRRTVLTLVLLGLVVALGLFDCAGQSRRAGSHADGGGVTERGSHSHLPRSAGQRAHH